MRITFFTGSVVGYVDHPQALLTRGLAHGLAMRGHDIRLVEERQNAIIRRTLLKVGAGASRHFHDNFSSLQYHTYEPRTGAQLLEWVTREIALIDVAVAVEGVEQELCRWISNVTRDRLTKAFLTYDPNGLSTENAAALEVAGFDVVVAPSRPAASLPWTEIPPAIASADKANHLRTVIPAGLAGQMVDPEAAAMAFEQTIDVLRR